MNSKVKKKKKNEKKGPDIPSLSDPCYNKLCLNRKKAIFHQNAKANTAPPPHR